MTLNRKSSLRLLVCCVCLVVLTHSASIASGMWSSACDSTSGWSTTHGLPGLDGSNVMQGAGSWKFRNSGERGAKSFPSIGGSTVLRFWFYDSDLTSQAADAAYVDLRAEGGLTSSFAGFGLNDFSGSDIGKYQFRGGESLGSTTWKNGSVSRSIGWHRIELSYKEPTGVTRYYSFYVDGVAAYTGPMFGGSDPASFATVGVGYGTGTSATSTDFRVDAMAVLGAPRKLSFTTSSGAGVVHVAITGSSQTVPLITGDLSIVNPARDEIDGFYDGTEKLTLTAPDISGYAFSGWSSDCGGTFGSPSSPTTTFTGPTSDGIVTANYVASATDHTLTLLANPPGAGTFTPSSSSAHSPGEIVPIAAAASPGYGFLQWTSDQAGAYVISSTAGFSYTMPAGDVSLYAHFVPSGATSISKISSLWPLVDGPTLYSLSGKTVTAVWTGAFWIEEPDRSAAVKVMYTPASVCTIGGPVVPGDSVTAYGSISTADTRALNATTVVNNGLASLIKPVGITAKYCGGSSKNNAPAVSGGKGIYSVGLLVKLAGVVGNANSVDGSFYLDDGSGLLDGSIPGIRVLCGALALPSSGFKTVTGAVGIVAGKPVIYALQIL